MEAQRATGAGLLKTVGACLIAPIILFFVALVWGGLNGIMMSIFSFAPAGVISFFSVVIGTSAGMFAARIACDKWLVDYSPQVVFFLFALLSIGALLFELLYVPFDMTKINSYVQIALIAVLSYVLFWTYESVDTGR
jgi:hypothetical protein